MQTTKQMKFNNNNILISPQKYNIKINTINLNFLTNKMQKSKSKIV